MPPRPPRPRGVGRAWVIGVGALTAILAALVLVFARGGSGSTDGRSFVDALAGRRKPDQLPVMLNREPPFRYPALLYARKVQGNVTLRIFIDRNGRVRPESTRVEESSGYVSLDSAAVTGTQDLRFTPAKSDGEAMAVSILFPVFFRHPEASPLPGDTLLRDARRGKRQE
jgi:TonB family protein